MVERESLSVSVSATATAPASAGLMAVCARLWVPGTEPTSRLEEANQVVVEVIGNPQRCRHTAASESATHPTTRPTRCSSRTQRNLNRCSPGSSRKLSQRSQRLVPPAHPLPRPQDCTLHTMPGRWRFGCGALQIQAHCWRRQRPRWWRSRSPRRRPLRRGPGGDVAVIRLWQRRPLSLPQAAQPL